MAVNSNAINSTITIGRDFILSYASHNQSPYKVAKNANEIKPTTKQAA